MTSAARDTEGRSRRDFLVGSGALTLAIFANGSILLAKEEAPQASSQGITAWVRIAIDDTVIIKVGATEMGQGIMTALPLVLAEELDADWSKVRVETAARDAKMFGNPKFGGRLFTAGSLSVEGYFDSLRKAGATARRVLIYTAARHWSVAPTDVVSAQGLIVHRTSGRKLRFGQVAALPVVVTDVPEITEADLKPRNAYRLIGTDVPRLDVPAKTKGKELYSIDVRIPDMVHAAVLRAPVEGETPVSVADERAKAMPGVLAVVRLPDAVAVVAEHWEVALGARELLNVEWTRNSPFRTADSAADLAQNVEAAADLSHRGTIWAERGDAPGELSKAANLVEADYTSEHVYHAQMEPLAVVAMVDADNKGAEIWIGTQSQSVVLDVASQVLDTGLERIRCHPLSMGGGFGRRTLFAREQLRDALLIAREVKRPVKLLWTREDDVKQGWFRPAIAHKLRAALGADGRLVAWHHRLASASVLNFENPEGYARSRGKDNLVMGGTDGLPYTIECHLAEHIVMPRRSRLASWRGIGHGHNRFATEAFIDELAVAAKSDPVTFRRQLLGQSPRAVVLLDKVVAMSRFGSAPEGRAHGLALGPLRSSLAAGVAEISLDRSAGTIRVHRVWVAVDVGLPIQPRNIVAQVEGGIIFGLSAALKERITIREGEVQQNNFYDYELLRASEVPEIHVEIVTSGAAPTGAGELGVPMTGAAVANAFYALTGRRLRHMPFDKERVKTVLMG